MTVRVYSVLAVSLVASGFAWMLPGYVTETQARSVHQVRHEYFLFLVI